MSQTCCADIAYDASGVVVHSGRNIFSAVRNSQGIYCITWTTPFAGEFYGVSLTPWYTAAGAGLVWNIAAQDRNSVTVAFFRRPDGAYDDPVRFSVMAMD